MTLTNNKGKRIIELEKENEELKQSNKFMNEHNYNLCRKLNDMNEQIEELKEIIKHIYRYVDVDKHLAGHKYKQIIQDILKES